MLKLLNHNIERKRKRWKTRVCNDDERNVTKDKKQENDIIKAKRTHEIWQFSQCEQTFSGKSFPQWFVPCASQFRCSSYQPQSSRNEKSYRYSNFSVISLCAATFLVILPCISPNLQHLHTKLRSDGFTLICDVFIIPTCIQQRISHGPVRHSPVVIHEKIAI